MSQGTVKEKQNAEKAKVFMRKQMKILHHNVDVFGDMTGYVAVEIAAYMGIDLLGRSLPRTPWDTGQLRRSGRVHVVAGAKSAVVARGSKSGKVSVKMSKFNPQSFKGLRKTPKASVFVSYQRMDKGKDVAIFTHENLNPHDTRPNPPAARQPGTGPKYLAIPFFERKQQWGKNFHFFMNHAIPQNLFGMMQTIRAKKGRFEVDLVKLIHNKIQKRGYYGYGGGF
jgi:hypothetical protein